MTDRSRSTRRQAVAAFTARRAGLARYLLLLEAQRAFLNEEESELLPELTGESRELLESLGREVHLPPALLSELADTDEDPAGETRALHRAYRSDVERARQMVDELVRGLARRRDGLLRALRELEGSPERPGRNCRSQPVAPSLLDQTG